MSVREVPFEQETDFTQARDFIRLADRRLGKAMVRVQRFLTREEAGHGVDETPTIRRIAADLRAIANLLDVVRLHVDAAETETQAGNADAKEPTQ